MDRRIFCLSAVNSAESNLFALGDRTLLLDENDGSLKAFNFVDAVPGALMRPAWT